MLVYQIVYVYQIRQIMKHVCPFSFTKYVTAHYNGYTFMEYINVLCYNYFVYMLYSIDMNTKYAFYMSYSIDMNTKYSF